jgi:hypothetical protein
MRLASFGHGNSAGRLLISLLWILFKILCDPHLHYCAHGFFHLWDT